MRARFRYAREYSPWSLNFSGISRFRTGRFALGATLLCALALGLSACSGRFNVFAESRDQRLQRLAQEEARLERTLDPVGRTRIQVRISDLLVSFMGDAVSDGDLERLESRMEEYRATVTNARDTMMDSGRDASRNSAGFRELEIALRQHMRQIRDIGAQLTVEYREPLDQLITDVATIRDELLGALFPGQNAI